MTKPKTDKSLSEILVEQEIQRLEENEAEIIRLKKQWFKLKMEEAYKRGREDEAIECQKDMERVVEETKREVMKGIKVNQKEFVKQANEVRRILEEERKTMTGAYDVTTRAGKKRFREMLRELVE